MEEKISSETNFNDGKIKEDKKQLIFLILLAIAIMVLIVSIILLVKYKNEIMSDPLIYGMEKHNFQHCTCVDAGGSSWESVIEENRQGFQQISGGNRLKLNIGGG